MIDLMKIEATFADLIDDRCEMFGVKNTIAYLIDRGFSKQDLIELSFDEDDIDEVLEEDDL